MSIDMPKRIKLFNNQLVINISENDWNFLCKNRFFTDKPDIASIEAEFVTGTGIISTDKEKWSTASKEFTEYIIDLREIMGLDICNMAKTIITKEELAS